MKGSRYSRPTRHVHPCLPVWSWRGQYEGTVGHKERKSGIVKGLSWVLEVPGKQQETHTCGINMRIPTYQVMASHPKCVLSSGFSVLPPNLMDFLVTLTPHCFPPSLLITLISVVLLILRGVETHHRGFQSREDHSRHPGAAAEFRSRTGYENT